MKIKIAQINPTVGDLQGNFSLIKEHFKNNEFNKGKADFIIFPELCLTGYPPNDLIFRKGFVDKQLEYIEEIRLLTQNSESSILIGVITKSYFNELYNSALIFKEGQLVYHYNKQLLPTYNIFDESRYFCEGNSPPEVIELYGEKISVLICEDCWSNDYFGAAPRYSSSPVDELDKETTTLITINASPSDVNKHFQRESIYKKIAKKKGCNIVYANQVGGNDDLIFDGHSFYYDVIKDKFYYAYGFKTNIKTIDTSGDNETSVPSGDEYENIYNQLRLGVQDYITKIGFKGVLVGSSGGIDSAVTLALLQDMPFEVEAITMPSQFSSGGSISDSGVLCNNLGIQLYERNIQEEVELGIKKYKETFDKEPDRLTVENMQARIRCRILMERSNDIGYLVLGTGNKSEISVGYMTLYGDYGCGLSVLGDLYKMEVYGLAKWINQRVNHIIPDNIINKEPSAELWSDQKDTDSLPPYPVLDAVLKLYIEGDLIDKEEKEELKQEIRKLTLDEIEKICRMTDKAEFKRRQGAPILRIHRRSFGFGRNLPIVQKYKTDYTSIL